MCHPRWQAGRLAAENDLLGFLKIFLPKLCSASACDYKQYQAPKNNKKNFRASSVGPGPARRAIQRPASPSAPWWGVCVRAMSIKYFRVQCCAFQINSVPCSRQEKHQALSSKMHFFFHPYWERLLLPPFTRGTRDQKNIPFQTRKLGPAKIIIHFISIMYSSLRIMYSLPYSSCVRTYKKKNSGEHGSRWLWPIRAGPRQAGAPKWRARLPVAPIIFLYFFFTKLCSASPSGYKKYQPRKKNYKKKYDVGPGPADADQTGQPATHITARSTRSRVQYYEM